MTTDPQTAATPTDGPVHSNYPVPDGGAEGAQWQERYAGAVMNTFGPPRLVLTRGEGSYVWDVDGNRYLDMLGGIAVNVLGQCYPALVRAVQAQVARLGHVSNFFATEPQILLAERLALIAGARPDEARVFLSNSGTEANEAAIKAVRRYGNRAAEDGTARTRILALEGAFHGRSTGALALTHKPAYREPFVPLPGGVEFLPFGDADALERAMGPGVAGLVVEPVQGEVGVRPLPPGYLERARELCDAHGALLVVDEIQSGMGRSGAWLAHQLPEIGGGAVPDIVTLAKGLGGGMPIGATIAMTPLAAELLGPGSHGTTFGGNPVCAAAALAVLGTIDSEGLLANAARLGARVRDGVLGSGGDLVREVRGVGLLLGIELAEDRAPEVAAALQARGVIVNAVAPSTIRLAPPLNLSASEAEEFLAAWPAALAEAWV